MLKYMSGLRATKKETAKPWKCDHEDFASPTLFEMSLANPNNKVLFKHDLLIQLPLMIPA